ncbi:MAG: ATP-binding protein, partial [Planctomycetota bacterium]
VRAEAVEVGAILRSAGEAGREAAERCVAEGDAEAGFRVGVIVEPMGAAVPATVPCDPSLFHQALANIVTNAVQAACEAGCGAHDAVVCGVRVGRELNADGRRADMLGVWVRDRGAGLPPDVRGRMFNPFFTTRAAGTGLGLAIVHRIIDAHGGRVRAENNSAELGGGATVELLLPLEPAVHSHRGSAVEGAVLSEPTLSADEDMIGALGRTEASV